MSCIKLGGEWFQCLAEVERKQPQWKQHYIALVGKKVGFLRVTLLCLCAIVAS